MNLDALKTPFPAERISWRIGATNKDKTKGLALAYIDARDVMERLDDVCGAANWQVRHPWCAGNKLACEIGILIDENWIWKGDGAGDTDVEAAKGAFSDALKRAAVQWGIGRYLYDLDSPWVSLMAKGKSYVISTSEYDRLNELLNKKPEPPMPWVGPLGKTELKTAMREFSTDLQACEEYDMLIGLLNTSTDLHDQCIKDLPDWWFGRADEAIDKRKKDLAELESMTANMGAG